MRPDPIVRPALADDRDAVLRLARDLATSYEVDPASFAATFANLIDDPAVLLAVAEADGSVVGYVLAQRHHTFHANGTVGWVEEVAVDVDWRGGGIGRSLMAAVEGWARADGAAYVALATRRAADFYTSLGYEPSATYFKQSM